MIRKNNHMSVWSIFMYLLFIAVCSFCLSVHLCCLWTVCLLMSHTTLFFDRIDQNSLYSRWFNRESNLFCWIWFSINCYSCRCWQLSRRVSQSWERRSCPQLLSDRERHSGMKRRYRRKIFPNIWNRDKLSIGTN